jgi:hypothetical protein
MVEDKHMISMSNRTRKIVAVNSENFANQTIVMEKKEEEERKT